MDYAGVFSGKETKQTKPIPGKKMVENSAGGYSFELDSWKKLDRFLILGSEGGTYYIREHELTVQNAGNLLACIKEDGEKTVNTILEISTAGRAPKNDPAIFALALSCTYGDTKTKQAAYDAITQVCRTGTHLFQFCDAIQKLRGWSRGLRRGVGNFYLERSPDHVALQLIKYQNRNGWSHRDVLRLAHPDGGKFGNDLFKYAVGKKSEKLPKIIQAFEEIKTMDSNDALKAVQLITKHRLPRECVPTELLNTVEVWDALLEEMPMTAMIRNLGKMSSVGLLKQASSKAVKKVVDRLTDKKAIGLARVHPMSLLVALKTYQAGHGLKGSLSWNPVASIVDALNEAFYLAFSTCENTGKNWLLGLDVSGSMGSTMQGSHLTCREAAAAMAMVAVRTEKYTDTIAFSMGTVPFSISKTARLDAVIEKMSHMPFDGTDCSQPMLYALKHKLEIDAFAVYTDSETWAGSIHPKQALDKYRQKTGRNAKLVVVGMTSNGFSIADPSDFGMLDVVGFDTTVPQVVSEFVRE